VKCYSKFLLHLLFIIPKKLFFSLTFPLAYLFRNSIYRNVKPDGWHIDEVIKHNKGFKLFIWFYFDDSIYATKRRDWEEYGLNSLTRKIFKTEFLKTWNWCGFRNTGNNFEHWLAYKFVGKMKSIKSKLEKQFSFSIISIRFIAQCREFEKGDFPYFEIEIKFKDRRCIINGGWFTSGKREGPKLRCKKQQV